MVPEDSFLTVWYTYSTTQYMLLMVIEQTSSDKLLSEKVIKIFHVRVLRGVMI